MDQEKKQRKPGSGGKREGAGRKPSGRETRTTTVCFVCTASEKEQIDAMAKTLGISRSEYIVKTALRQI